MSSTTIAQPPPGAVRVQQGGPLATIRRRTELEASWRARLERVTDLSLAYHDAAQQARHGAAAGRSQAARRARQLARRTVIERQALAEIEAALDRISNGQYGRCEQCRGPISAALLARRPQARYCTACGGLATQPVAAPAPAPTRTATGPTELGQPLYHG
jgi:RNA polymerase-binding transcription factor DksA